MRQVCVPRIVVPDSSAQEWSGVPALEVTEIEITCDGSFGPHARYKGDTAHARVLCTQSNIRLIFADPVPETLAEMVAALALHVRKAIDAVADVVNVSITVQRSPDGNEF